MNERTMPIDVAKDLLHKMASEDKNVCVKEMMKVTGLSESACRGVKRSYHIKDKLGAARYEKVAKALMDIRASVPKVAREFGISETACRAVAAAERITVSARHLAVVQSKTKRAKPQAGAVLRSRVHESMSGDGMSMEWLKYNMGHVNYKGWNYWGCGV